MIRLDSYPSQVPHKSSTTQESMLYSFFQKILIGPNQIPYMVGTNTFLFPILRKLRLGQHTLHTAQMHQKREERNEREVCSVLGF